MGKKKKYTIEKKEPGFIDRLLGKDPEEEVLKDEDGQVVAHIKEKEPSFVERLFGEERSREIIDPESGEKIGDVRREEPSFLASLFWGEKTHDVVSDQLGNKVATVNQEEPGVIERFLGKESYKTIRDTEGREIGQIDRQRPGFLRWLFGEKPNRRLQLENRLQILRLGDTGTDAKRERATIPRQSPAAPVATVLVSAIVAAAALVLLIVALFVTSWTAKRERSIGISGASQAVVEPAREPQQKEGSGGSRDSSESTSTLVDEIDDSKKEVITSAKDSLGSLVLYGIDSGSDDGSSTLVQIDKVTGEPRVVGETSVPEMTDIACTPDGSLYGITGSELFSIDGDTGFATNLGDLNIIDLDSRLTYAHGLASNSIGELFGTTVTGQFFRVETSGNVIRSGINSSFDLAFSPTGSLFGAIRGLFSIYSLEEININTGWPTTVGQIGFNAVFGLAFDGDDTLFAVADGDTSPSKLIKISTETGAGSLIGNINAQSGITGLTSCPEK